jgi:EamA domain-containing membrane protein RarD
LVVAAAGYFLFPLATALLGALVIGAAPLQQLAGAVDGLGIGMLITVRVVRTLCIWSQKGSSA